MKGIISIFLTVFFSACSSNPSSVTKPESDVVQVATTGATRISGDVAWNKIRAGALLVDVRSPEEFKTGAVKGAINIPHTDVESNLSKFGEVKDREIVLYCHSGRRAGVAKETLERAGYTHVFNVGGLSDLNSIK